MTAAAAARVEAERSCAVRNTHFHHQPHHHTPAGCSTGLSWLGTSAPKSSVFAPLSGAANTVSHANSWNDRTEKSAEEETSRFQSSDSPVKMEIRNTRSRSDQLSSSVECNENVDVPNDGSATSISSVNGPSSTTSSNQNAFHTFPTPPKEETENGNSTLPLTPSSGVSSASSGRQTHQQLSDKHITSEQLPSSSSSIERCQLPQQQSIQSNIQLYQNAEMKQESLTALSSSSTSTILPYSHAYIPPNVGSYGGVLSSYSSSQANPKITSMPAYSSKGKSKSRSSTGMKTNISSRDLSHSVQKNN